jgi:hypothetical protein
MDNLFSEDPQFRRVQYKKLSDNAREWQQEISAMVSEKLPRDLGVDVTVVFQQVDDEKGYALGTAIGRDTASDKTIGIPVIVKAWYLAPIDLFFAENQLYPLTDDNLAKIFYQNSLGAGVAPHQAPPNMVDDVYADMRNPPLGGKYSYSAPLSMLKLLSGTLGEEDLRLFKEAVAKEPAVLGGYYRHHTYDLLRKYAAETPKPDQQDEVNKARAEGIFTIKKDGPDAYRLYSSTDEVYDPVMVSTNRAGIQNFLNMSKAEIVDYEQDPMAAIDQNGTYTLVPPTSPYGKDVNGPPNGDIALGPHKNPWVFDPLQDDKTPQAIDTYGRFGVRDRDGVLAKGWVIPNVVDFDGGKVSNKLFLGKALCAYQSRIVGIPLLLDDDVELKADRPDTGKTGVLVYRMDKDVVATLPFQIMCVTVFKNLRAIGVIDARGKKATLIFTPSIQGIVKVSPAAATKTELSALLGPKDNYFVGGEAMFIRTPRLCQVSESPDEFKRITADWLDYNPIKVAMSNGRYILRGGKIKKYAGAQPKTLSNGMKKVAFDFQSLARHEAEFLLASWGLPMQKVAQVLEGVKTRISLDVHHLRQPEMPDHTKSASSKQAGLAKFASGIKAPIGELVKIAANLEDAQTVDSVLSLGFINPENVSRFASAKPMLWETSHMLAKLLLASRLGMEDIPEESVRAAIGHLQRVLDGLDRLKMLEEQQTKTSAAKPPITRQLGGSLSWGVRSVGATR